MYTIYRHFRAAATRLRILSALSRLASSHLDPFAQHEFSRFSLVTWRACQPQIRGKKIQSSLKLDDLPQGVLPLDPLSLEEEVPAYPTVVLQARSNMRKFENCVVLTRVGGFYELYFEHAKEFGPLLNLKVAQKRTNGGNVPMAGFPFFQLDRYLKILVQDFNRYVAIAEEFPNDPSGKVKAGGLMHDRRVSRVITPGTLIDEDFIDPFTNNYVLAIHTEDHSRSENPKELDTASFNQFSSMKLGLAWLDLSTGQFFTQSTTLSALPTFLARIAPREIVLNEDLQASKYHDIFTVLAEFHHLITYMATSEVKPISEWLSLLESPVPAKSMNKFSPQEIAAGSALLRYVETRLQSSDLKLQPPLRQMNVMGIDKNTMAALEIRRTLRDGLTTGSLLHTIRRTVTQGGARLLDRWLTSPSTSITTINSRLDLVTYMLNDIELRERTTTLLRRCHDSHRLLQKFAFGRGDPDDVLALASTIIATHDLVGTLRRDSHEEQCIQQMVSRIHLNGPSALSKRIKDAIDEEGVVQQQRLEDEEASEMQAFAQEIVVSQGSREDSDLLKMSGKKKKPTSIREHYSDGSEAWIMKPDASPTLKLLHSERLTLAEERVALSQSLSERLGVTSLTLRFTPGLGHICHVKGKDMKTDLSSIRSVSSSKSTRSFHHPEWTSLGQRLDQCRFRIRGEEQAVFNNLRKAVISNIVKLRRNASVLDELDIACSFATLASEKNWTRPILTTSSNHKIIGGRHPTVEGGLEVEGQAFVSNDCFVGTPQKSWLITGPNMAGKSTFLRQNALITLLAQIGSYVPAQYAELGIVDQLFSRVGSADNLYREQSTFMVEMLETSFILRNATSRSFVIMDEIGRGTTPEDGTAIGFACLWHLGKVNKCRTLFATHFHMLADIIQDPQRGLRDEVGFYCTDVDEDDDGGFRYVHKLKEGVNKRSHALKVARLAGLPEKAISVAREILGVEETREIKI